MNESPKHFIENKERCEVESVSEAQKPLTDPLKLIDEDCDQEEAQNKQ